jgi:3-oxoacyl-[acyl-carrier protein] reductase
VSAGEGRFAGQTVVVTGGTRGLGRATTLAFLAEGATVHATYHSNREAAEALLDQCGEHAERLRLAGFDVGDHDACEAFWGELETAAPDGVQVLVSNAGLRRDGVLAMMPAEDWDAVLRTNLGGTYNMCKFAVQNMVGQRYGRIVIITSPAGNFGFAGQGNYAASKAGQVGLMRALCKEVARRKITVNCVSPGFIDTELIADLPEALVKEYQASIPLRRFGSPEDVAYAVQCLAARDASYITGTTLEVTGGL